MPDPAAVEYLKSLLKRREAYTPNALGELSEILRRHKRETPGVFEDSSFLYMRSYDGDIGNRPFSSPAHWRSPDILVSPVTSIGTYTRELNAGETYVVRCNLRNRGDLSVPSAKVELFLTTPSLGFDTRFASNLTLGQVPTAWVTAHGSGAADFLWTVPPTESGHKCMFARAFSFSPLDIPIDDFQLDPRLDRHVAQLNLNIIAQAQPYQFNLIHLPEAAIALEFAMLEPDAITALRHPALADFKPVRDPTGGEALQELELEVLEKGAEGVEIDRGAQGYAFIAQGRGETGPEERNQMEARVAEAVAAISAGRTPAREFRDLFAAYRKMSAGNVATTLQMKIPDFGLDEGQMVGFEITATHRGAEKMGPFGGITVLVVAE